MASLDYTLASRAGGFDSRSFSADREFRLLVGLTMLADVLASAVAPFAGSLALPGSRWAWLGLGVALACSGCALRYWAILTLGRLFRFVIAIQNNHRVITGGPYRLVRHPAYTGALLIQLGIGIALASSLSLLICVAIPMIGVLPRIRREEITLTTELGGEYQAYAASTKRLIPKIW